MMLVQWSVDRFSRRSFGCASLGSVLVIVSPHCWWQMPRASLAGNIRTSTPRCTNLRHPSPTDPTCLSVNSAVTHETWAYEFGYSALRLTVKQMETKCCWKAFSLSLHFFDPTCFIDFHSFCAKYFLIWTIYFYPQRFSFYLCCTVISTEPRIITGHLGAVGRDEPAAHQMTKLTVGGHKLMRACTHTHTHV